MNKKSDADVSIAGSSKANDISSVEDTSSSDSSFTAPAAKKGRRQTFRDAWLQNPYFKSWLARSDDPCKAMCTVCSKLLKAHKSHLEEHAKSESHIMNPQQNTGAAISVCSNAATSNSNAENDSSSDSSFVTPSAKKGKWQVFQEAWLQNSYFKSWLARSDDPCKAMCTVCSKLLKAHKGHLREHAESESHIMNLQQNTASISVCSNAAISNSNAKNDSSTDVNIAGPSHAAFLHSGGDSDSSTDVNIAGPSRAAFLHSGGDSDSSSDSSFVVPTVKKGKRQAFREAWLQNPDFKSWLARSDDPCKAMCTVCSKLLRVHKRSLEIHANSDIHIMNMRHQTASQTSSTKRTFADEVKAAEIRICINAIEHDISFRSYCHFVQLIKTILTVPDVLPYLSTERTKMIAIAKNVLNKSIIVESTEMLRGKFFSLLIDETTDISETKILCFLLRYLENGHIRTYLLDLVELSEAKAENLYTALLHSLRKYNLKLSNMIGVCVDNANVMVGPYNSVTSRLLKDNPEICVFPCICHSLHLVASHAYKCLPSVIDDLLHSIYAYFCRSSKRQTQLKDIQQFLQEREQKILKPAPTRWLALSECLKRILNQWKSLFSTFSAAHFEDGCDIAEKIFNRMNCPLTLAYLQFLDYVLDLIVKYNTIFQTSSVIVHRLVPQCFNLLKKLAENFVKPEFIRSRNLHELNVDNVENVTETVFLGAACNDTIDEIIDKNCDGDLEKITELYAHAKQFYQCAFKQLVKRMPFKEPHLQSLDFLQPDVALDLIKHRKNHLVDILNKFKSKFDKTAVQNEWFHLSAYSTEENKQKLLALSTTEFWDYISTVRDDSNEYEFKNISKLAQLCLSLPHSNADVERYFSHVTRLKSKSRNRLTTETVAALTRVRLYLLSKEANCSNLPVTNNMIKLYNHKMYDKDDTIDTAEEVLGTLRGDVTDDE